jgi:septation ring formation regulator EzrA
MNIEQELKQMVMNNIEQELKQIESVILNFQYNDNDLSATREYLAMLSSYKARVNSIYPDAQLEYDRNLGKITEEIIQKFEGNIQGNSSYIKNYIQTAMRQQKYILNICERINSTIERASENLRTNLSSKKAELNNLPE